MKNEDAAPDTSAERIVEAVSSWPGITVDDGRFGSTSFQLAGAEIGHLHPRLADIRYPHVLRERLIADGRTEPHHVLPKHPTVTTFRMASAEDVDRAIRPFRLSSLARVAELQRAEVEEEPDAAVADVDVRAELDALEPDEEIRSAFEESIAA